MSSDIPDPLPEDWPEAPPTARRGRGAVANVVHRYQRDARQAEADGWDASCGAEPGLEPGPDADLPPLKTEVAAERARTILVRQASPDLPFDRSLNPYRGCEHGCVYCYARPSHAYLGWSPGLDFETRLVAKVNAVEALRRELARPGYQPRTLALGTNTDAYQPIERHWKLTRGILELMLETRHPVALVTKGALALRDIDVLARLAEHRLALVHVTVTTLDASVARVLEPRAAAPARRLDIVRALSEAGVPVGVSLAPVIPFITDDQIERVLEAASRAGARSAFYAMLRLPWELKELFADWLEAHFPDRKARVLHRLEDLRGGRLNDPRFGTRMTGEGIWADLVSQRFRRAAARLGLNRERIALDASGFRPPVPPPRGAKAGPDAQDGMQMSLFG